MLSPFAQRLIALMEARGLTKADVAKLAGVNYHALNPVLTRDNALPNAMLAQQIADGLGIPIEHLTRGAPVAVPRTLNVGVGGEDRLGEDDDFVAIPRRDVRLSGGHGFENLDDAPVLDRIPFTREFLRDRLNRTNINGLVMVKATGDSMEPTIGHDDLVMVDAQDWEVRPGIFAVVLQGEAMVKRLEQAGDRVAVISDNKHYPPLYVGADERHAFHVIGRVRWIGRVLQ